MARRILIVDDNDLSRDLLHDVLAQYGYDISLAGDGAEGVRMAQQEIPDLILMDIQMPVMNGLEAVRLLRADPRTRGIKIVALSSYNLLEDCDNSFSTRFDGYFAKPFDIRALPKFVSEQLRAGEGKCDL